ncbi:hypothetical protein L1987_71115 [Smallanthus sonchifolius]|uniref:Uncharacterized protein n=1 Tax=Smallanthus sonchifolius TaxID=185202 RepID=A0ACB9ASW4_9ASTR|nr:hypothetical protein L1987_71115 [Smallanthus sonchifolius]
MGPEVEGLEDMFSHLSDDMPKVVHGDSGRDTNLHRTSLPIIEHYGLHTRKSSSIRDSVRKKAFKNDNTMILFFEVQDTGCDSCPCYMLKQTEEVVPDQNLWRMRYHPQGLLLVPHGSEDGSVVVVMCKLISFSLSLQVSKIGGKEGRKYN